MGTHFRIEAKMCFQLNHDLWFNFALMLLRASDSRTDRRTCTYFHIGMHIGGQTDGRTDTLTDIKASGGQKYLDI